MDGTYGFSIKGVTQTLFGSDEDIYYLADSEEYVVSSGYGVFYKNSNWYILDGLERENIYAYDENVIDGFSVPGLDSTYKFRFINQDELQDEFERTMNYGLILKQIIIYDERDVLEYKEIKE